MQEVKSFKLNFIKQEKHLLLPNVTTILVTQRLYDILFQYAITPEKEEKLKSFIAKLESHIKSKPQAPFSMPLSELEFLDEGLEELKLLNWMEANISLFEISGNNGDNFTEDDLEKILTLLDDFLVYKRLDKGQYIYVYPARLTNY